MRSFGMRGQATAIAGQYRELFTQSNQVTVDHQHFIPNDGKLCCRKQFRLVKVSLQCGPLECEVRQRFPHSSPGVQCPGFRCTRMQPRGHASMLPAPRVLYPKPGGSRRERERARSVHELRRCSPVREGMTYETAQGDTFVVHQSRCTFLRADNILLERAHHLAACLIRTGQHRTPIQLIHGHCTCWTVHSTMVETRIKEKDTRYTCVLFHYTSSCLTRRPADCKLT